MLSTKFASQQLKKHLLECSDSFLVSPTFPLAQCLMFRPSFSICRYRSQQHEKHCFDANLLQHRRSHDQKTKKGPQSEKTLSLPLILCRSPTLHSLDSPFLTALLLLTWETTLLRATVYSNLVLGTTAWILWMPISDDECMLLVPHRESQPDMCILSAHTAARPNSQVCFSPIPNLLLLKPAEVVQRRAKSPSCHRHQHRVIQFTASPTRTQVQIPAWQQQPTVSTVQPTFKIASTPTPSRSFAKMSQAVQFCALLENSPGRFYGLLRSARLQMCVSYQKTPSLTERSGRRFLTGDLAGLFSQ